MEVAIDFDFIREEIEAQKKSGDVTGFTGGASLQPGEAA
jgi:hypothetical protein